MIVFGIKNCDTMQKAFRFLDSHKIKYTFHNYKTDGIDTETLKHWLKQIPIETLVNAKGLTYKNLTDEQKSSLGKKSSAAKLIRENTSLIRRPLVVMDDGTFLLGFNEAEWLSRLSIKTR